MSNPAHLKLNSGLFCMYLAYSICEYIHVVHILYNVMQHFRGGYRKRKGKETQLSGREGGERSEGTSKGAGYTTIVKENALLEKYYKV